MAESSVPRGESPGGHRRYDDDRHSGSGGRYDDGRYGRDRSGDWYSRDRRYDDRRGGYGEHGRGGGWRGRYDDRGRRDRYDDRGHPDRYDDRGRGGYRGRHDHHGGRGGGGPRHRDKMDDVMELTRDARTVFVGQLVVRAREEDVRQFFEQVGRVADVVLIRDRSTGRSRGFGYVEMAELDDVPKALLLNGEKFPVGGFPVQVRASEAEKNYARAAETEGGTATSDIANRRVFVANLHPDVTEEHLHAIFSQAGPLEKASLVRDVNGVSRGYAFLVYQDQNGAAKAMTTLHNLPLVEQPMRVGTLNAHGKLQDAQGGVHDMDTGDGATLSAQARAAMASALAAATSQAHANLAAQLEQMTGKRLPGAAMGHTAAASVGSSVNMNSQLAAAGAAAAAALTGAPAPSGAADGPTSRAVGRPSQYLVLKGMMLPALEASEEWEAELAAEVAADAAGYGDVLAVVPDPVSVQGLVYVAMGTPAAGKAYGDKCAGRTYEGRTVEVQFLDIDTLKPALRALKGQGCKVPVLPEPVTATGHLA